MAIDLTTNPGIAGRITAPDVNYPGGSSKNETAPGAADGTPYIKARADDIFGLQQALLADAGLTASGNADTAIESQYLEALGVLLKTGAFKNGFVNGDFSVNQQGLTFPAVVDGDYTSDQSLYSVDLDFGVLSANTVDVVPFAPGQSLVKDNPENFLDFDGAIAGGGTSERLGQVFFVENAASYSGKLVTLSFNIKADNAGTVRHYIEQDFGTGGAPDADVLAYNAEDVAVDANWQKVIFTFTMPSVSGKTFGTTANSSFLKLRLDKIQGTAAATAAGTAGAISLAGGVQIADIQIEEGRDPSRFERLLPETMLDRCRRFLRTSDSFISHGTDNAVQMAFSINTDGMRVNPTLDISSTTFTVQRFNGPTDAGISPVISTTNLSNNGDSNILFTSIVLTTPVVNGLYNVKTPVGSPNIIQLSARF